jgi:hypothetical protein
MTSFIFRLRPIWWIVLGLLCTSISGFIAIYGVQSLLSAKVDKTQDTDQDETSTGERPADTMDSAESLHQTSIAQVVSARRQGPEDGQEPKSFPRKTLTSPTSFALETRSTDAFRVAPLIQDTPDTADSEVEGRGPVEQRGQAETQGPAEDHDETEGVHTLQTELETARAVMADQQASIDVYSHDINVLQQQIESLTESQATMEAGLRAAEQACLDAEKAGETAVSARAEAVQALATRTQALHESEAVAANLKRSLGEAESKLKTVEKQRKVAEKKLSEYMARDSQFAEDQQLSGHWRLRVLVNQAVGVKSHRAVNRTVDYEFFLDFQGEQITGVLYRSTDIQKPSSEPQAANHVSLVRGWRSETGDIRLEVGNAQHPDVSIYRLRLIDGELRGVLEAGIVFDMWEGFTGSVSGTRFGPTK